MATTYTLIRDDNWNERTASRRYTDNNPVDYRHMANIAASIINAEDTEASTGFLIFEMVFLQIERSESTGRVFYDADTYTPEVAYILAAIRRALAAKKVRLQNVS